MISISACLITYNHLPFIEKCIQGMCMQILNSKYEIVIGDDCSNDKTSELCQDFALRYPETIKYQRREVNLGMVENWLTTIKSCSGKYIAFCEGDDYWTDPYKLQKQVDFLEQNPEYVACFHDVKVLMPNGDLVEDTITSVPAQHETIDDLARDGNYIHTPSVVFRNVIREYPTEFKYSPVGDYFLYMLLAQYGKFKYMKEEMAVYRYGVGVFSANSNDYKFYNFQAALFLIWHYIHNRNKGVSNILFRRIKARLGDDLLKHNSITTFLTQEGYGISLISEIIDEMNKVYLDDISENNKKSVDTFLKNASVLYLFRVIFYKFRRKITLK